MGLALAIKRSYRYIGPSVAHLLRGSVRDLYTPTFYWLMGYEVALVRFVPWPEREPAMNELLVVMFILVLLRKWAKEPPHGLDAHT